MSKRRRISKKAKKRKIVLRLLFTACILIFLLLMSWPYLQHISAYRNAINHYDFEAVTQELAWMEGEANWLKKIPSIQEGELWVKLNQGVHEGMESELVKYEGSHPLWLFQLYLVKGQLQEANEVMKAFNSTALKKLAEGLLWAAEGEKEKAINTLLTLRDSDYSSEELVLKDIALTKSYMALEKYDKAQKCWQAASKIAPEHPLVLESEYDLALATGQWGRAKELSSRPMATALQSPYREQVLVKKALLALVVGDRKSYQSTQEELKKTNQGEACIQYLTGLEVYERGEFSKAQQYLQKALDLGLPDFLKNDATLALEQAKEREEAETSLQAITGN